MMTLNKIAAMLLMGAAFAGPVLMTDAAFARPIDAPPALSVSNGPMPSELRSKIYNKPARAPAIKGSDLTGKNYFNDRQQTVVGQKVAALSGDVSNLQNTVSGLADSLASIENSGQNQAAEYYASVATISTQLQSGTTPGNPRLIQKLSVARTNLEQLSSNVTALNDLAVSISGAASNASYLLETVRATYGLSGAVEEDHVHLAQMEDNINGIMVVIDRLLNNVNDDITRTTAYMTTERDNLRTLSAAITAGDMFGKSLSNRPFSSAKLASFSPDNLGGPAYGSPTVSGPVANDGMMTPTPPMAPAPRASAPSSPRPLVKIRFDRADVNYKQPVYMAVNEALARYPDARFELVAVHPQNGNAAQVAIESTKARRNAESVLRSLTEMGLDTNRVDLSYAPSESVSGNEVHLYIR